MRVDVGQHAQERNPNLLTPNATAIIILAAGESSRMGRPKQLLLFRGQSLLRHAAQTALATPFRPVVVVLGANADLLRPELDGLEVQIVLNPDWQQGMSRSLQVGITAASSLILHPSSLLLMLCDQPFVTPELLSRLAETGQETGKLIVACDYGGSPGVPAWFHHSLTAELLALQGAAGAKQIFAKHSGEIAFIPFPEGEQDIDTPEDYARLSAIPSK